MINGTDIELYSDGDYEVVSNILIGEPSSTDPLTYTIAIPKGDAHDWLDKKVRFFGYLFRTIGLPEQGIEENIPLFWNKKIKAEFMRISGNCTIYEKHNLKKHVFRNVFFCDSRGEKDVKPASISVGVLSVKIYSASENVCGYSPKAGDYIVCEETEFEFDTSSQTAISKSLEQFRRNYPDAAVIKSVNHNICGLKFDRDITAV